MEEYVVEEGDCLTSIAKQYGFLWEDIWNLAENHALRELRKDPNVLNPGDVLWIPDKELKEESRPTEKLHRFVRLETKAKVRLQLLDTRHKPRASLRYTAIVGARSHEGTTDSEGYLTVPIAPNDEELALIVWDSGREEIYELALGSVDPVDEMSGVQHRLMNLGYDVESEMGESDLTCDAIGDFQRMEGLLETGQLDGVTRQRLMAVHGS